MQSSAQLYSWHVDSVQQSTVIKSMMIMVMMEHSSQPPGEGPSAELRKQGEAKSRLSTVTPTGAMLPSCIHKSRLTHCRLETNITHVFTDVRNTYRHIRGPKCILD